MDRYINIKILFGHDEQGKECICKYDNPNCPRGYNGLCEEINCKIDRFSDKDLQECFNNKPSCNCKNIY
jgi:hypothetical protein